MIIKLIFNMLIALNFVSANYKLETENFETINSWIESVKLNSNFMENCQDVKNENIESNLHHYIFQEKSCEESDLILW